MNYILFDDSTIRSSLLPFTFIRPVSEIRVGIYTITQKWENALKITISLQTEPYIQKKYPLQLLADNVFINGAVCPTLAVLEEIKNLSVGEGLYQQDTLLAYRGAGLKPSNSKEYKGQLNILRSLPDIFDLNATEMFIDFENITKSKISEPVADDFTAIYSPANIFIEKGVQIRAAVLNAENGPIYIGKNVKIMEGSILQGPVAVLDNSHINTGAKIRPNTTIGPNCKVGGEVSQSVFLGNSNKAHDGFMGNSVIGEWCNWGADTNNSNLKNDYGNVKLWNYATSDYTNTGKQFVGLFMGDYSKAGINTMFNTGTVTGISANIFGAGFQPKFIPSFSWGGADTRIEPYRIDKAVQVIKATLGRRNYELTTIEENILTHIFEETYPKP